ncbi:hypothetical protein EGW08_013615 [Elysia chlorotica]|uniref:Uncharacterized protein n=1 Tax=Elysia chlorotica TaxID=188477 RepID=A0A3S0ZMS2_ELYCH|nr:hypothetical protein EGW08_013615 [Elysia chlorotica]
MTRRPPDRAHVRRSGQARCPVGLVISRKPPTAAAPAPSKNAGVSPRSPCGPHVPGPARDDPHTDTTWASTPRLPDPRLSPPLPPEISGRYSSTDSPSQSNVSIITSPSCELLSCSWRISSALPQCRLQTENCVTWQSDEGYTQAFSQFEPDKPHKTVRTSLFAEKYKRSHSEIQVTRPCHEQSCAVVIRQQRGFLPTSLVVLCFLLLLPRYLVAKPAASMEREGPGILVLKTPLCEPVSQENLRRMMGPYYDSSRMAADMPLAKRDHLPPGYPYHSDHSSKPSFQGDDPRAKQASADDDLVQEEILWSSDKESDWGDDGEDEGVGDERVWLEEKEVVESIYNSGESIKEKLVDEEEEEQEEVEEEEEEEGEEEEITGEPHSSWHTGRAGSKGDTPGKYRHKHRQHRAYVDKSRDDHPSRQRVYRDSYAYMKRRRRKRSPQLRSRSTRRDFLSRHDEFVDSKYNKSNGSSTDNIDGWANDGNVSGAKRNGRSARSSKRRQVSSKEDTSSDIAALTLKMVLNRKNKKLRKSLKKQFRQNAKSLLKRRPPWDCKMATSTLILKEGVFPRVLVDGTCRGQKQCFYRLYDCKPQFYTIKMMQRDPNHCNPLPKVGNTTVFEERWNIISRKITVGCNCVNSQRFTNRGRTGRRGS